MMFEFERVVGWVTSGDAASRSNCTKPGDWIEKLQLGTLLSIRHTADGKNKAYIVECVEAHTIPAFEAKMFETTHQSTDQTLCLARR